MGELYVPLAKRIDTVLTLHAEQKRPSLGEVMSTGGMALLSGPRCRVCRTSWPCLTVRSLTTAWDERVGLSRENEDG